MISGEGVAVASLPLEQDAAYWYVPFARLPICPPHPYLCSEGAG